MSLLPNPINPVELVKTAALEAIEANKPVHLIFGTVISVSPLKIQIDQKTIYTESMLILTRNVTDYEVDISFSCQTEIVRHGHPVVDTYTGGGSATAVDHQHTLTGKKKGMIHNALLVGDKVVLARMQKGKQFIVLDRIAPIPQCKGEWL